MFTICGSGFGLYGYLPALLAWGKDVVLPKSYAQRLDERPELLDAKSRVSWVPDGESALDISSGVIIALPPAQQIAIVERCLDRENIRHIMLEKPLAVDPSTAATILSKLQHAQKRFEVGYSFLHAHWLGPLRAQLQTADHIFIEWRFMAHHFRNNVSSWKRYHSRGGGTLRFYGIHLLAVLAHWGYDTVHRSTFSEAGVDEWQAWDCTITGPNVPPCRLHTDSRSSSYTFSVTTASGRALLNLREPFMLEEPIAPLDPRVPLLLKMLKQFDHNHPTLNATYDRTNELWRQAEDVSTANQI